MNELQRLHYLDALGITQWVAKAPLPFAKPTDFISLSELFPQPALEDKSEGEFTSEVESENENEILAAQATNQNTATKQELSSTPKAEAQTQIHEKEKTESHQSQPSKQIKSVEEPSVTTNNIQNEKSSTEAAQENFTCALHLQGKRGQYLVLAELSDHSGKISQQEQVLLNNISKAIDVLYDNASTSVVLPEQFKWPLFESQYKAQHIDQSKMAAMQSAKAFFNSKLKRHQAKLVVVLGADVTSLLGLEGANTNASENNSYVIAESLSVMLSEGGATAKSHLWQNLLSNFK